MKRRRHIHAGSKLRARKSGLALLFLAVIPSISMAAHHGFFPMHARNDTVAVIGEKSPGSARGTVRPLSGSTFGPMDTVSLPRSGSTGVVQLCAQTPTPSGQGPFRNQTQTQRLVPSSLSSALHGAMTSVTALTSQAPISSTSTTALAVQASSAPISAMTTTVEVDFPTGPLTGGLSPIFTVTQGSQTIVVEMSILAIGTGTTSLGAVGTTSSNPALTVTGTNVSATTAAVLTTTNSNSSGVVATSASAVAAVPMNSDACPCSCMCPASAFSASAGPISSEISSVSFQTRITTFETVATPATMTSGIEAGLSTGLTSTGESSTPNASGSATETTISVPSSSTVTSSTQESTAAATTITTVQSTDSTTTSLSSADGAIVASASAFNINTIPLQSVVTLMLGAVATP